MLARKKAEEERRRQEYLARQKAEWEYKNLKDETFGFTREFFDYIKGYTLPVAEMYKDLLNNALFMDAVNRTVPSRFGTPTEKFKLILRADLIKCYDNMGHNSSFLRSKEGVAVLLLEH